MCFSTEASFSAAAVLTIVGIATLTKVKSRSQIPFALIPLIFGAQQLTEGFVWLSLLNPDYLLYPKIPTYLFLIIAQIVWPVWVPFSIWCIEKDKQRETMLGVFFSIGIIFSCYLIYSMINYPTNVELRDKHIHYVQQVPHMLMIAGAIFYFMATVVSPLLSKNKSVKTLGGIIFVSFLVSKLFFADNVVSVWCFFAAILSVIVFFIIKQEKEKINI